MKYEGDPPQVPIADDHETEDHSNEDDLSARIVIPVSLRDHSCRRNHQSWASRAACQWRRALWVMGEGPYATLAWCPVGPTVMLHETFPAAVKALGWIDDLGCGHACIGDHEIVVLDIEAAA
jgi:hypothetical protein